MKRLYYLLFSLLAFCCFYCFYHEGVMAHVLYYQEQHHLFLFSKAYATHLIQTEGVIAYIATFIIQFFYYPILGSAIMAMLIALVSLLTRVVIKRLLRREDILHLSLIPALYFLVRFSSIEYPLSTLISTLLALLLAVVVLATPLPLWKLFAWLPNTAQWPRKRQYILSLSMVALYVGFTFYYFVHTYNASERTMVVCEKLVKEKEWDEVLQLTKKYQLRRGTKNQLISYFYHLALYHTGNLTEELLHIQPSLGVESLYFPWQSDSRKSEYGHYIYEYMGSINEAHRWAFEAMVVWGETAPHLLNLIRYNIVNERPKVAQRFINILKQSLFYRDEALALEQALPTGKIDGLSTIPVDESRPIRFANVLNIAPDLQYICELDPTNRMAFEYLMSNLLLSNQLIRFVGNLPLLPRYGYNQLPRIYEEALFIYKVGVEPAVFDKLGVTVSKETERRFQRYYALYTQQNHAAIQAEFGNTYWYYLHYVSPYGSKINSL